MNEHTAVIIGASGLIGSNLLYQILVDEYFGTVRILVRKKLQVDHPKLEQMIVDFNNTDDFKNKFGSGESIFCCIGTTQKKVNGDKSAYKKIDHDIPVNAADIGRANGFKNFLVVSSVGANPSSSNFYLKLKGKTEEDIKKSGFKNISIFRPSMLLGKRNEKRTGEKIGQAVMKAISFLFMGKLKKYKPINAENVAKAMIAQSKLDRNGIHILEYTQMMELLNKDQHQQ